MQEQLRQVTCSYQPNLGPSAELQIFPMPGTARMTAESQRHLRFELTSSTVTCNSIISNCLIATIRLLILQVSPLHDGNRIRRPHHAPNDHQSDHSCCRETTERRNDQGFRADEPLLACY